MRPASMTGRWLLLAGLAAAALGLGAVVALLGLPTSPRASTPVTVVASPRSSAATPLVNASPTVPAATPLSSPRPGQPVELALTGVDSQPDQGGLLLTVDATNHRPDQIAFAFDPRLDVTVRDARGRDWSMRWAEYQGAEKLPSKSTTRLVRIFFAGDVASTAAWPLDVSVTRVPTVGSITWRVAQSGATTSTALHPPPTPPALPSSGPIKLTVGNVVLSSELGGVEVNLDIQNGSTNDLSFQLEPGTQISAVDNRQRSFRVRWAQYDGTVRLPAKTSGRLARVFLEGPVADGTSSWIQVTLKQVPGSGPLSAIASLG